MAGMSMRLELRQEQKQEQRLSQEQVCTHKLSLEQYSAFRAPFEDLHNWCQSHPETSREYKDHDFNFNYFQVPLNEAEDRGIVGSPGWFVSLENGVPFRVAIEDIIPEWMLSYVALHERGEEISMGDHFLASKLEFAIVDRNNETSRYQDKINDFYPGKFVDLIHPIECDLPNEIIEEIEKTRQYDGQKASRLVQELANAGEIIEGHDYSQDVVDLANKYFGYNQEIGRIINKAGLDCQELILGDMLGEKPKEVGGEMLEIMNLGLQGIPDLQLEVLRPHLAKEYELSFSKVPCELFARTYGDKGYHFLLNDDLKTAIESAKRGEDAVEFTVPRK